MLRTFAIELLIFIVLMALYFGLYLRVGLNEYVMFHYALWFSGIWWAIKGVEILIGMLRRPAPTP